MKSNRYKISLILAGMLFCNAEAEVLNFSTAYGLALENANNIRSAVYASESEKEKINQEKSQLYPQINLSTSYRKGEYETNPSGRITRQGLITHSATARQNIYNDEVYTRVDLQEARSKYSKIKVERQKEELAQELFKTYLDILKSKNRINLLESYLEYTKTKLDDLTKRFEMSMSNKMDLFQMRVEYASSQIELDKEKKLFSVHELKFKRYIGDVAFDLPDISSDKILLDAIKEMKNQVSSNINIENSYKVQEAKAALITADADLEYSKAGHLPKLTFDAAYSKYETDDPTIDAPYNTSNYAMISLNLPIYSGGYVSSRVESSLLMKKSAIEDLTNTKKEVTVAYNEYMVTFEASAESVSMYKNAIESAELYVEAINQGYEHGLKSVIDLNEAKNKLNEVKYKYVENLYQMVNSYIGLLMVTNNFKELNLLDKLIQG